MKTDINIPIPKKEDIVALNMRRENYALTRDQQAMEFNQAISKRLESEARNIINCDKCGKEFVAPENGENVLTCPNCLA